MFVPKRSGETGGTSDNVVVEVWEVLPAWAPPNALLSTPQIAKPSKNAMIPRLTRLFLLRNLLASPGPCDICFPSLCNDKKWHSKQYFQNPLKNITSSVQATDRFVENTTLPL